MKVNKIKNSVKVASVFVKKYRMYFILAMIMLLVGGVSFTRIMDRMVKHRRMPVEFLVVHWTANTSSGADARANAYYLRNKRNAGTHYCIDDKEIVQCTDEQNIAYAVGDPKWFRFVPKPWYAGKIYNNNSISFEMCLGGDRNDSIVMDWTAQLIGKRLVTYGLDMSRVVRHHDVSGKHCPKFCYRESEWNQVKEDSSFTEFKKIVERYYQINMFRKQIWKQTNEWVDTIPPYLGEPITKYQVQ